MVPITLAIVADVAGEGDESFSLVLSGPAGLQISAPSTHLVTIADDDVRATKTATGRLEQGEFGRLHDHAQPTRLRAFRERPRSCCTTRVPEEMSLTAATASSGSVSPVGNRTTWTGDIGPLGTVTVTLEASINPGTGGMLVSNQGTVHFDGDGDGAVEATVLTDDPEEPGAADPTVFQVGPGPVSFYTLPPCRVVDTRTPPGRWGGPALAGQADRTFTLRGSCGIPDTAKALAMNLTVTGATRAGHLRLPSAGTAGQDVHGELRGGQTRANNAIVALDAQGRVAVFCGQSTGSTVDLILDINGYFE